MPHAFDLGPEAGSGSVPFHFGPFYFGAAMQASGRDSAVLSPGG